MPKFSVRSKTNLSQCHIDLQTFCNHLIQFVDISIICGHRGKEAQNKAFDDGFSKVRWPNSRHNKTPSEAVDIAKYPIDWKDEKGFRDLRKFALNEAEKLYRDGKITHRIEVISWDLPHYQLKIN